MKISIALVEPLYQINIGYIARIMKNFSISNLYIINPRCNYKGKQAIMYSKHAHDIIESAMIVHSISEAKELSKPSMTVGTTGIWRKTESSFHNIYTLEEFARVHKAQRNILLVLGRDDIGMTKSELEQCDATIFIEASSSYPVLNISHALAVLLYELNKHAHEYKFEEMLASSRTKKSIMLLFKSMVETNPKIRNKKAVTMAFEHMLNRSMPREKELKALAIALSK